MAEAKVRETRDIDTQKLDRETEVESGEIVGETRDFLFFQGSWDMAEIEEAKGRGTRDLFL